jgi:hypothetical protein
MRVRRGNAQCGKLQLRYRRTARQIDAELTKPRRKQNRKVIEELFRRYNETRLDALDYDCGWAR